MNTTMTRLFQTALFVGLGIVLLIAGVRPGLTAEITAWTPVAALPDDFASMNAVIHGNHLFVVGGKSSSTQDFGVSSTVFVSAIGADGNLAGWTTTTPLREPLFLHATVATDQHLYVIGGYNGRQSVDKVWRSPFLAGGQLGPWERMPALPRALHFGTAVLVGNHLFVMGGYRDGELFDTVYYAAVNPDGLSDWRETRRLPERLYRHTAVADNGRIYLLGGRAEQDTTVVLMTQPGADGQIGVWQTTTALPQPRSYHAAVVHDGRVVVLGGNSGNLELDSVISAPLNTDGSLGVWRGEPSLPETWHRLGAATHERTDGGEIYVIPGRHDEAPRRAVYRSGTPPEPTSTPPPTATLTPTPQPTPLAPPAMAVSLANTPRRWVAPGEEILYTIHYRNVSDAIVHDLVLVDRVPAHTELISDSVVLGNADSHLISDSAAGATILWQFDQVPPGGEGDVAFRVVRSPEPTPPVPFALDIAKSGPAEAAVGDPITYTLTITNLVPITFTDLLVEDVMPLGAHYLAGGDGAPEDGVVRWQLTDLAPHAIVQVQFAVTATSSLVNSDYRVAEDGGTSAVGRRLVFTRVGDTPFPVGPDGVVITNDSAFAAWTQDGEERRAPMKPVLNPSPHELFLPIVQRR